MSFSPLALMKRVDSPLIDRAFNRPIFYLCNSVAYLISGSLVNCYFGKNGGSLETAFLITGLISGILNIGTIHEARKRQWNKETLKSALTTEDFICDATLLTTIATMKSLAVNNTGLRVGAGLVGLDLCLVLWDSYWARKEYKHPSQVLIRAPSPRPYNPSQVNDLEGIRHDEILGSENNV